MKEQEKKVHLHHCCNKHGCKYGDRDCPVADGTLKQAGPILRSVPEPPAPPPKRIIKEDINKTFLKGFLLAFLIVILIHISVAYVVFN